MTTEPTATDTTCVICHEPNPTDAETCSPTCDIDLAFATGRITDYPEETHVDTQTRIITPMSESARAIYVLIYSDRLGHLHEPGIQCLECRQAATNIAAVARGPIVRETVDAVHDGLIEYYTRQPADTTLREAIYHSRHMARTTRQDMDLHRIPDAWVGTLPEGVVEA